MTGEPCFVDSNVPMYAAGDEHPMKAPCLAFLQIVARGEVQAVTSVEVLQELLHRYTAMGKRRRAVDVAKTFMDVVPDVLPVARDDIAAAFELHLQHPALPTRDVMHLATMSRYGLKIIVTADQHFDGVDGIRRVDPADWSQLLAPSSKT